MRYQRKTMRATLWTFTVMACLTLTSSEYLMGGHMDNTGTSKPLSEENESPLSLARSAHLDDLDLDLDAEESTVMSSIDEEGPRYRLPYSFAFNGGRPFSLEKDPITGKIDFEKAPPVRALNYTDAYPEQLADDDEITEKSSTNKENVSFLAKQKTDSKDNEDVSPNEINPYSPNFHDFLNLPVHYSSDKYDKDKYPLISSSYANTKVQSGSNSYSTYNHKPYHGEPVYHLPSRKPYVPKTTQAYTTTPTTPKSTRPPNPITTTSTRAPSTTTTVATTTTTTRAPSTTVSSSTKAPAITTWKPPISTIRYDHGDDYEDLLPIERLQPSMYLNDQQGPNNIYHNQESEMKPPMKTEEYDAYDDYELNEEGEDRDYIYVREPVKESTNMPTREPYRNNATTTMSASTSQVAETVNAGKTTMSSVRPSTTTTTTTTTTTPSTTTTSTTTTASPLSTTSTVSLPQNSVFSSSPLQFQVVSQRPATSMPLDGERRNPPIFENTVDNRRPILGNPLMNQGYRPSEVINQKLGPGGIVVESTSNIVIPPDQDTVSFVLGNRQNVESGYYSLGTAIGENPYNGPIVADPSFRPLYGGPSGASDNVNYDFQTDRRGTVAFPSVAVADNNTPQTWRPPTAPSTQKLANEVDPSRVQSQVIKGTVLLENPNDKKDEKDTNYVVFPKDEENQPQIEEHIVVINEADGSIREITPSTTTTKPRVDTVVPNNDGLPQLSENLTPPAEHPRPMPPFYHHHHHGATLRPDHPRPMRLPLPPRGKQPPSSSHPLPPEPLGIRRRPYKPDPNLPNILPQFRPNAKTSHGHRGSEAIGTIPAGQYYSTRVRPPLQPHPPPRKPLLPPPSYLQRLNPPPPPIHALRLAGAASSKSESVLPPREPDMSVKRFRVPPVPASSRGDEDNKQTNRVSGQKMRLEEEERPERYSEEPPQLPPRPPLFPKRRTADPPHVATLQMIQQHGAEFEEDSKESSVPASLGVNVEDESDAIVTSQEAERRKSENRETVAEAPVYVVYPVNTAVNIHPDDSREKDESVVIGTRGPHRPLPPETLLQDSEEQENDSEGSLVTQNLFNNRPIPSDFPYPLERPDSTIFTGGLKETPLLVPSDQRDEEVPQPVSDANREKDEKDTNLNIIPYLQDFVPYPTRKEGVISATLHRSPNAPSSTPIAYVYTPTAQASHRLSMDTRDEEVLKVDRNDQKPVLLPSQQPSSSSSSAPSPQNFMAPFVASVSAEAPAKNGWSVVMVDPPIDRKSDEDIPEETSQSEDTETTKGEFDPENFKPQLFGGFKPIYEFPVEDTDRMDHYESTDINSEMPVRARETGTTSI